MVLTVRLPLIAEQQQGPLVSLMIRMVPWFLAAFFKTSTTTPSPPLRSHWQHSRGVLLSASIRSVVTRHYVRQSRGLAFFIHEALRSTGRRRFSINGGIDARIFWCRDATFLRGRSRYY